MSSPVSHTVHAAFEAFSRAATGASSSARVLAAEAAATRLATDASQVSELARSLVGSAPAKWSQAEWGTLDALAGALAVQEAPELPTALTGIRSLGRIINGAARGDESLVADVGRYMQAWEARLSTPSTSATHTGMDMVDATAAGHDWQALRRLIDADPSRLDVLVPELRAKAPDTIRTAAHGEVSATARRVAAALDAAADPTLSAPAARRELALSMIRRDIAAPSSDEWRRLAAVVDIDVDRTIRGPVREVEDLPDLAELATGLADGQRPSRITRRALDAWELVVDGTAQDPTRMRTTLEEALGELRSGGDDTSTAVRRLGALLDVDTASPVLPGPRRLAGAPEFTHVLRDHLDNGGQRDALERYVLAWERSLDHAWDDPATVRQLVHDLVQRHSDSFGADDWKLLAQLADHDAGGTALRVPMLLDDGEPLAAVAMRAAHGKPVPDESVERLLDAWRIGVDPAIDTAALRGRLESLLARVHEGEPVEPSGWRELAALLRLGPSRHGVPLPAGRPIDASTIATVDRLGSSAARAPREDLLRTLEAWHMRLRIADGSIDPTDELRSIVTPESGQMDVDRWRRVGGLLDAIADGTGADVPVPQKLLASLQHEAERARSGVAVSADTATGVLDDVRHALDPTWISEQRAAAWAALEGGRVDQRLDANLLRSLDPHHGLRSPFERLAIDAAGGAFPADNLERGRELVKRVLDLPHAPANMPDNLASVWRDMQRLAEVNMERLKGRTPKGEVKGYANHPDYAQLGRIKADIELIRRMTPTDHPIAATPPPDATVKAIVAEQLTW